MSAGGQPGARLEPAAHTIDAHLLASRLERNAVVEITLPVDDPCRQRCADETDARGPVPRTRIGVGLGAAPRARTIRLLIAQRPAQRGRQRMAQRQVEPHTRHAARCDRLRLSVQKAADTRRHRRRDITGNHVHDSADRRIAIQQRCGSANDLDALRAVGIRDERVVGCGRRQIGDALAVLQRQDPLTRQPAHDRHVGHRTIESHRDARFTRECLRNGRTELSLQVLATELNRRLRHAQRVRAGRRRRDLHARQPQRRTTHHHAQRDATGRRRNGDHLVHGREAHRHEGQVHGADRRADEREPALAVGDHHALQLRGNHLNVRQRLASGIDDDSPDRRRHRLGDGSRSERRPQNADGEQPDRSVLHG